MVPKVSSVVPFLLCSWSWFHSLTPCVDESAEEAGTELRRAAMVRASYGLFMISGVLPCAGPEGEATHRFKCD